MSESNSQITYRNYLLTAWQTPAQDEREETKWRFLIADPYSGRRYGFTTPEGLLAVLEQLGSESLRQGDIHK